jgi:hypothetical protein
LFSLEGLYITIFDVENSEYWSKLIKLVSGCVFAHLSNLAQTRKASPVILFLIQVCVFNL